MIDLHSHILPGLDDGARDLDDALEIARTAAADGIRAIAATPHVRSDYPTTADEMERGVAELRAALREEEIKLRLLPGGEIALEELEALEPDELRRFGLGGNPSYLLLETPYTDWPMSLAETVFRLKSSGTTPVIAHPERNATVQRDPERVEQLVRTGALIQVTAASLDGRLGSSTRACARELVDAELVHLIGSDAHSAGLRAVGMWAAYDEIGDEDLADWLTRRVPGAIATGGPLPPRPASSGRRGRSTRLLGR